MRLSRALLVVWSMLFGACKSAEPNPGSVAAVDAQVDVQADAVVCGDGTCSGLENFLACPADCPLPPCGDHLCSPGETVDACPADCGHACGNDACETGENPLNCPADCGAVCGNAACEFGESPESCPADCQDPCGDGTCGTGENPFNCPADCKPACGDGTCAKGEDPTSCPFDCAPACGDGVCDPGENVICPSDCCADCEDGLECTEGKCLDVGKQCAQVIREGFCLVNNACFLGGEAKAEAPCLTCQPVESKTAWTPADGLACTGGDACSIAETCVEGVCVGVPKSCDDDNTCTTDFCVPASGCAHDATPGACDDGDACTKADACVAGACAGVAFTCDDGLDCTADACLGDGMCDHVHLSGTCLIAGACYASGAVDPADACHVCKAVVASNAWTAASFVPCEDEDACTDADVCYQGTCAGKPVTCLDDGDSCTDEVCSNPFGCLPVAIVCTDDNPCTKDGCAAGTGCTFTPTAAPCNDGDDCTQKDSCVTSACAGTLLDCDDGTKCTDDACQGGKCVHADLSFSCNDGDPCTKDDCLPSKGCVSIAHAEACDDGNQCTLVDLCQDGKCLGGLPLDCNDALPCTQDFCSPSKGCQHVANPATCQDGVACTTDACVLGVGCTHLPVDAACDDGDPCTLDTCGADCGHEDICTVRVFDTTDDVLASSDVRSVVAWDAARDSLGSSWRQDKTAGWALEADEQLDGRSAALPGYSGAFVSGCAQGFCSMPVPTIELPLGGAAATSLPATVELWVRIAGPNPILAGSCTSNGDFGHELLIYDGPTFTPSQKYYCNQTSSTPPYARFDMMLPLGTWATGPGTAVCPVPDGDLGQFLQCSGAVNLYATAPVLGKETWTQIAVTVAPISPGETTTRTRAYVNGALVFDEKRPYYLHAVAATLRLALRRTPQCWNSNDLYGGPGLTMTLDDVALFGEELTASEIVARRLARLSGTPAEGVPDPLTLWSFDPGSPPFLLASGARLTARSSDRRFPALAYAIGTGAGLDILDGDTGHLHTRFETGDSALGAYYLGGGVSEVVAADGALFVHGDGLHRTIDYAPPPNAGSLGENCKGDPCFLGACNCAAKGYDIIARRNGHLACMPAEFGVFRRAVVLRHSSTEIPTVITTSKNSGVWPDWPQRGAVATDGEWVYVAAERADGACSRIEIHNYALSNKPYSLLYLGSFSPTWESETSSCGAPAATVTDLEVTNDTSILNPQFNTLYVATTSSVAIVHEASYTDPTKLPLVTQWSKLGGAGPGHAILPSGPYTAITPCGGLLYIGTKSKGIVALDPAAPSAIYKQFSAPKLPSNDIRDLSCTELGPQGGLHRVLVATPAGAVEVVGVSK